MAQKAKKKKSVKASTTTKKKKKSSKSSPKKKLGVSTNDSIKKKKRVKSSSAAPRLVEPEIVDGSPETSGLPASADPLTKYLNEIRRYPLLTKEEEQRLAKLYFDEGDKSAAEKLVTSNLRFVVKVAAEYSKFGARLIDLVQEGNVGLMHAVREFNPYKGVRLITYAVWWIRGYIQEYLMKQYSMVRIGTTANQRKLFYQLQKQKEELERLGFDEGVAQLSGRLGVPEEEIKDMHKRLSGRDLSLDQPLTDDESSRLMDYQSYDTDSALDDELGRKEELQILNDNIEALRSDLSDKELILLEQRLLADEPKTLQEIGDDFGVTREAVRQMESRLIQKIKAQMSS